MTSSGALSGRSASPEVVMCRDSLERALLDAADPAQPEADGARYVPLLGRRGELPEDTRRPRLNAEARAEAVPPDAVGLVDAEAIADWITARYTGTAYPAVVLGSPHGAAVHLAAALGVPWLPTTFTMRVAWPNGSVGDWAAAADWGATVAEPMLRANPAIGVRQVHDPVQQGPLCAAAVSLHVRWRALPRAYERFLRDRLAPGGTSLLLRDLRNWPAIELGPGHSFQIGSPGSGWSYADYDTGSGPFHRLLDALGADRWARPYLDAPVQYSERAGDPALGPQVRQIATATDRAAHRVLYASATGLSACVADLYREHLRTTASGGQCCLIETGRLMDPYRTLRSGLVPYWCESPARSTVAAAEWWLAGSRPFEAVTVLPEPPGTNCEAHAEPAQWRSLAAFGTGRGRVDRLAADRYPRLPLPRSHVARVVAETAEPGPAIRPLTTAQVVAALRRGSAALGLLIG